LKRDEDFEDLFSSMRDENVFAACLQETWREGLELLDRPGLGTVVLAGKGSQSGRGSLGVGIALGLKGVQAWKDAGSVVHDGFGPCAMAIRLLVQDDSGEEVGIHLVSLYRHSDWDWNGMEDTWNAVIDCKRAGDVVIVGTDCNAHLGVDRSGLAGAVVGPFGNVWGNDAGEKMKLLLASRSMVAASTFFKRGRGGYGTWRSFAHPHKLYQIDHFFCLGSDLMRVTNCKRWVGNLADTDHAAVILTLRVQKKMKKSVQQQRDVLKKRDYGCLVGMDEETEKRKLEFGRGVRRRIEVNGSDSNSHDKLVKALVEQSLELPRMGKGMAPWYVRAEAELGAVKLERNEAVAALMKARPAMRVEAKRRLREVRGQWRKKVRVAKSGWIEERCNTINNECVAAFECGKKAWDAIKQLKAGLQKTVASTEVPKGTREQDAPSSS